MDNEKSKSTHGKRDSKTSQNLTKYVLNTQKHSQKSRLTFDKRPGTSGIDGQLYETKLLCLILLRATKRHDIEDFFLAANVDKVGVFDDIVFRYQLKGHNKPKIIFVQAKHKNNPNNTKVTLQEMFKDSSDFNLVDFFNSYCLIRLKFDKESKNETDADNIFQGQFDDVECQFILYTSANENFKRKKISGERLNTCENDILYTSSSGCTFQFDFNSNDVKIIMEKVRKAKNKFVDDENIKTWIEDFFSKLKFYTNQAKQMLVEEIVKENIEVLVNVKKENEFRIETNAIFLKVHDKIQYWWRQADEVMCLTKNCNYFETAKQEIAQSPLLDKLNFTFTTTILKTNIQFSHKAIQALKLDKIFEAGNNIIVVSQEVTLSCIKILQYFQSYNTSSSNVDFTCLDVSCIEQEALDNVVSELNKTNIKIIVVFGIECNKTLMRAIFLVENIQQQAIIVTDENFYKVLETVLPIFTVVNDKQNRLLDLSSESQIAIENRTVTFQGTKLCLGALLDDKSKDFIQSRVLLELANYDEVEIGNLPLRLNTYYEELIDTYIQRTLGRCIKLQHNKELMHDLHFIYNNQFVREICENKDLIVVTENSEDFEATLSKYNTFKRNIHWFVKEEEHLIWKKTRGKLDILFKFVNRDDLSVYKFDPNTIIDIEDDVVIIIGEPGMGKSSLLCYLYMETKQRFPNYWVIFINLRDHGKIFEAWKQQNILIDDIEALKFLCHAGELKACKPNKNEVSKFKKKYDCHQFKLIKSEDYTIGVEAKVEGQTLLELELFIQYFNNRKVAVMVDGFDESVDYKDEVITLLKVLKTAKVNRLWITSRTYDIHNELENEMGTFSYILEPLTINKQKDFLQKYWRNNVGTKQFLNGDSFVEAFYDWISKIYEKTTELTTNVQHLFMVAEVFSIDYLPKYELKDHTYSLKLVTLYKHFINAKSKIYEDSIFQPNFTSTSAGKRASQILRKDFLENHMKMAILAIFGNAGINAMCSKQVITSLNYYIQLLKRDGESTGIIEKITGFQPKFIHLSYAEYFASEFISDKIKSRPTKKSYWQFIFERLLLSNKQGVRRFFNSKLEDDDELARLTSRKNTKTIVFSKLAMRYRYESTSAKYSSTKSDKTTSTALYVTVIEDLFNITNFLLRTVEGYLNNNNLKQFINIITAQNHSMCILCAAVHNKNNEVVEKILNLISSVDSNKLTDVFNCKDVPYFNPLMIAAWILRDKTMVDVLLKHINKDQLELVLSISFKENFKMPLVFLLAEFTDGIKLILPYLEKLDKNQIIKIFSNEYCDYLKQVPAHNASVRLNFDFFYVMKNLLTRDQFLQVCNTRDGSGWTPIDNIEFNSACNQDKFRAFISDLGL